MSTWHIYSLTDPRDGRVRYVGKTDNLKKRLRDHVKLALTQGEKNHRANWIRNLVGDGKLPTLSVLESGTGDWIAAEKKWIATFRAAGLDLVNSTDGGDGCEGYRHSEDIRARISDSLKGHHHSPETLEKIRTAARNRGEQWREKLRLIASNRSPEEWVRITAGRKEMSPETRARVSSAVAAANRVRRLSPETRSRLSAASKGRTLPAAFVAHIGVYHNRLRKKAAQCPSS